MKAIVLNARPRRNRDTAQLLKAAQKGAERMLLAGKEREAAPATAICIPKHGKDGMAGNKDGCVAVRSSGKIK